MHLYTIETITNHPSKNGLPRQNHGCDCRQLTVERHLVSAFRIHIVVPRRLPPIF